MSSGSKARILMLLDSPFPLDERVEKEALSLQEDGHKVFLMCYAYTTDFKQDDSYKGIEIHRIGIAQKMKQKTDPFIATLPWLLRRIWLSKVRSFIRKNQITHIHAHDLPLCSVASQLANEMSVKFVADMHENYPALVASKDYRSSFFGRVLVSLKAWYRREIEWLKTADAIIVTAPGMMERLQSRGIVAPTYCLLENTIKRADYDFDHHTPDDDYVTIFYSGGINQHRGLQYAIRALAELTTKKRVRFWIVGKGKYEGKLRELAVQLGLDNVHFLGWKSVREMFELMTAADIGLIPHKKSEHTDNTSPNKLFHYFYAGKPVLVSNCHYLQSVVSETDTGRTYQYDDHRDLAKQLDSLIAQLDKPKWKENAWRAVREKYNWKASSQALLDLYR